MANKTTKQIRRLVRKASKDPNITQIEQRTPVYNYHSDGKSKQEDSLRKRVIPTAHPNKEGLVSASPARNMGMFVFRNQNADGSKYSITRHEPLTRGRNVRHPNHSYMKGKYSQPK